MSLLTNTMFLMINLNSNLISYMQILNFDRRWYFIFA